MTIITLIKIAPQSSHYGVAVIIVTMDRHNHKQVVRLHWFDVMTDARTQTWDDGAVPFDDELLLSAANSVTASGEMYDLQLLRSEYPDEHALADDD